MPLSYYLLFADFLADEKLFLKLKYLTQTRIKWIKIKKVETEWVFFL
jgi:hypothetical protein